MGPLEENVTYDKVVILNNHGLTITFHGEALDKISIVWKAFWTFLIIVLKIYETLILFSFHYRIIDHAQSGNRSPTHTIEQAQ